MLKSRLVIVGAGDFARELLWCCSELPKEQRPWSEVCFVDDAVAAARDRMHSYGIEHPVIGTIKEFVPGRQDFLTCSIGNPRAKLVVCEQLRERGGNFINVIHPTAWIGPRATLGMGVIMTRLSGTTVDVRIGDFVTINCHSGCGHDAVVEDGCTLSSYCEVTGHAHLERGVFLGSHAAVMPGVRVGQFAVVGAGSTAFRNVKAGQTVVGVPAKVLL